MYYLGGYNALKNPDLCLCQTLNQTRKQKRLPKNGKIAKSNTTDF